MKIAAKFYIVVIPLVVLTVLTAGVLAFVASASALEAAVRNGMMWLAADMQRYSAEQASLLFTEGYGEDALMRDAAVAAIGKHAADLVGDNPSEVVFALDAERNMLFYAGAETHRKYTASSISLAHNYLVRAVSLADFSIEIYIAYERRDVLSGLDKLIAVVLAMLVLMPTAAFIFIHIISRSVTRPLRAMQTVFDGYSAVGKQLELRKHVDITPDYRDETGALVNSFNIMIKKMIETENELIAHARGSDAKKKIEEKRRTIFQLYAPSEIVRKVLKNSSDLISGQKCEASILYSGVRHITPLSENLAPAKFIDFLNRYFLSMTRIAGKRGGVSFNIEGDALLAGWGVPNPRKKDAVHALHAALLMIDMMKRINADNVGLGLPPLAIGIGLDAGFVTAGNIASDNKVNWSVMGGPVSAAVELQELTKKYREAALFTENIYKKVYAVFPCRFVDKISLRGQGQPGSISIFTARLKITGKEKEAWKHHRFGVKLFYARKFPEALLQFEQALLDDPQDGLSAIFIKRCRMYIKNPPPPMWDGSPLGIF